MATRSLKKEDSGIDLGEQLGCEGKRRGFGAKGGLDSDPCAGCSSFNLQGGGGGLFCEDAKTKNPQETKEWERALQIFRAMPALQLKADCTLFFFGGVLPKTVIAL